MTTTLLRKALHDYLDHNTTTADDYEDALAAIKELDEIDRLESASGAGKVWRHECYIVHAEDANYMLNELTYDIYGKLFAQSGCGSVGYDLYAAAVRKYFAHISTPLMESGYSLISDVYDDNEQSGCHNPDGTFNYYK